MGQSRKDLYSPRRKLTIPPNPLQTLYTNLRHSLDDSPPPPWMAKNSSVGGVMTQLVL